MLLQDLALTHGWQSHTTKEGIKYVCAVDICLTFLNQANDSECTRQHASDQYRKIKGILARDGIEALDERRVSFGVGAPKACITMESAIRLVFHFRGKAAEAARTMFTGIIRRYFEGDVTLADEVMQRASTTQKKVCRPGTPVVTSAPASQSPWRLARDAKERVYYWNIATKKSIWPESDEGYAVEHLINDRQMEMGSKTWIDIFNAKLNRNVNKAKQAWYDFDDAMAKFGLPQTRYTSVIKAIDEKARADRRKAEDAAFHLRQAKDHLAEAAQAVNDSFERSRKRSASQAIVLN